MRFPALPHLGLQSAELDFSYAKKLDMHRHVVGGSWSYEPDVLSTLFGLLAQHEHSRFINIGANMGYFSVLAKKLFGSRVDVHAYEPMPELVGRLSKAQTQNRIEFRVSNAALSDFEGTAPFHLSAKSDTSNSLNPDFRPAKDIVEVSVTTLDSEFPSPKRRLITRPGSRTGDLPTVLLVDTESTEPAVLRGGLEFIARVRPAIICEVLAGRTEADLADIIESIGYEAHALTDSGPQLRDQVVGDRTYEHRDWLFLPPEASMLSLEDFAATFAAVTGPTS